jgi:hypothetical protein
MAVAFNAFAERTKDQLEDIGAAGGIFSAGQFANIPGFPKTFQGAMEMQDKINKEMATIASTLPGTTHDYVANSRRLVDTTAQVMARDMKGFMSLATELTGKMNMSAEEAFRVVNVEVAKATTMLEKLNPAKTVIPMTQIVEDMMKDEKVTIGGLRRYVSFRRSTTFEAALQRNIDELNKTGAGTANRLKMIIKVLKQAAPPEMVGAFQSSVAGVIEGFKSALMDPDVGLFGLSRTLTFEVKKFDRETGKYIGKEFTNFFKMFSEVFGNIGNLINNSIMPGLQALYQPFDSIAKQFERLREVSYKIFERQQQYNAYFDQLADKYGMRREDFKVFEKGGVSALMDILQGFGMLDDKKYIKYRDMMEKNYGGDPKKIAESMRQIYADIIPTIFKSPFFKELGKTLGNALANVFKEIAKIMKALLRGDYGTNEFLKAFYDAGGMDAINEILMYVAEMIGKVLLKIAEVYMGALFKAVGSGNFAAAGVLGALGLVFGAPAIAGIKVIASGMKMLVNAFKILTASKVVPTTVKDLGSVITDPRRMLPPSKTAAALPSSAIVPAPATTGIGGFLSGISKLLPVFAKLSLILSAIVLVGGGVENSMRQLKEIFSDAWASISSAFGGLFDTLGILTGFIGDAGRRIGEFIGGIAGIKGEFDGLKIAFAPVTLALQALGIGLRGLALAFAELRVFLARITGDKEYQQRIKERDELAVKLAQDQGRANAYNASMLGKENVRKQMNDAIFVLQNSKVLKAARSAELKSFIAEARTQLGDKKPKEKPVPVQVEKPTSPAAKATTLPAKDVIQTNKNTAELNQKAVKQLTASEATKAAVVAQKASLGTIQSSLSAIFALLASGGLRVQTQQQTPNIYINGQLQKNGGLGDLPFDTTQTDPNKPSSIFSWAKGGLGDAIASEMRMKPPGSDLVIANSSETVIPAAGGNGMMDFVETLRSGFNAMVSTYKAAQQKQENVLNSIRNTLVSNQQQTNTRLQKLETKFTTPGMAGGLGGAGAGGVDAFTPIAQRMGLTMTSGYRPGDPGWHGANRARDFSNGTGPTPQMMQFAQYMATTYGQNLKELIYTPLGFSIKNGQRVAPYAQGSHYNHVHVAYALGAGNPAFFSNKEDAVSWENKFLGKGVKSITTNTAELARAGDGMFGPGWLPWNWGKLVDQERKTSPLNRTNRALEEMVEKGYVQPNSLYRQERSSTSGTAPINITAPITINQQPGQDADELASIVALKIGDAVAQARSASVFV